MDKDARCLAVAARQLGLITRAQALEILSADAIRRRCRGGLWRELLPGIFAILAAPESEEQQIMAAALWVRSDAKTSRVSCTSHTTAAYLLGLCRRILPIHVSTPRSLKSPVGWMVVHRTCLGPVDIASSRGIPITIPAKTLLDLGAVSSIDEVESALEAALRQGTVSFTRLQDQLRRYGGPGHRGSAVLRALLEDRSRGYTSRRKVSWRCDSSASSAERGCHGPFARP